MTRQWSGLLAIVCFFSPRVSTLSPLCKSFCRIWFPEITYRDSHFDMFSRSFCFLLFLVFLDLFISPSFLSFFQVFSFFIFFSFSCFVIVSFVFHFFLIFCFVRLFSFVHLFSFIFIFCHFFHFLHVLSLEK